MKEKEIREQFQQYFSNGFCLAAAPGRVNLIGEHTDYNQGFVLPGAIDRRIYVGLKASADSSLKVSAPDMGESFSFAADHRQPVPGWPTYLIGMLHMMLQEKKLTGGLDIVIRGDVPVGAGMSSSAALCAATGLALNEFFGLGFSRLEIALAAQQTEHRFAGVKTGIMDQFASLFGRRGQLIRLDCRSMDYEYLPFHFPGMGLLLLNTMVSHSLASSEYNLRRQQCEEGVAFLRQFDPKVESLRDVSIPLLESHRASLDPVVYKRCRFVLEENQRLLDACTALRTEDPHEFGKQMWASHLGLSQDYEVSCPESDFLVGHLKNSDGVLGARQMGGGFGGCIIALVEEEKREAVTSGVSGKYHEQFAKDPAIYVMTIEDGAEILISA